MKKFMDEDFLLSNGAAWDLYHTYAEKLPIIDYHCHISPREIAEDKTFDTITELWLSGDHYKWRLMRSNGIDEKYITGDASDRKKFQKWVISLERAIGNPLYHWSHLELKRYFGYEGDLNVKTAEEVWTFCNQKIKECRMSARTLIKQSNVTVIGTTDDPIDELKWHESIAADDTFDVQVRPMWRPDQAISIEKSDYLDYIKQLSEAADITINSFQTFKQALSVRLDYFEEHGCTGSDHGLLYVPAEFADKTVIETIFVKRLNGEMLTSKEEMQFKTACLLFLGREYAKRHWVMQLHVGATRNNNSRLFKSIGADTGFDSIYNRVPLEQMSSFLNALNKEQLLPKTIIYSLNPTDNAAIGTIIGCFQESGARGKIQQGSAWWFNDHEAGMRAQMTSLANLGVLGNFAGMLTDSRSFLSYTRHEYFRRILCDIIGSWVETGRYPADMERVGKLVEDICYHNVNEYFNFQV